MHNPCIFPPLLRAISIYISIYFDLVYFDLIYSDDSHYIPSEVYSIIDSVIPIQAQIESLVGLVRCIVASATSCNRAS